MKSKYEQREFAKWVAVTDFKTISFLDKRGLEWANYWNQTDIYRYACPIQQKAYEIEKQKKQQEETKCKTQG